MNINEKANIDNYLVYLGRRGWLVEYWDDRRATYSPQAGPFNTEPQATLAAKKLAKAWRDQ